MQVSGSSNNSWIQKLQQELLGSASSTSSAGQSLPSTGQQSTPTSVQDLLSALPLPPPPATGGLLSANVLSALFGTGSPSANAPTAAAASSSSTSGAATTASADTVAPSGPPGGLLGSSVLGALFGTQQQAPFDSTLAGKVISSADGNGDGQLSQAEVSTALTPANGTAPDAASLSAAFAKLDTNGDGQLSQTELTAGLQAMQQDGQTQLGALQPHHPHHHPAGGTGQFPGGQFMTPDAPTTGGATETASTEEPTATTGTTAS
jgi:hypothetical protein